MKKLFVHLSLLSVVMTSLYTLPVPKAHGADIAQSLCEYVAADDKKRMRSFLRTNKLKIRNVFEGIQCNGQNLLEFAATRGSMETGSLMISKLPKHIIESILPTIQSNAQLTSEAQERLK